MTSIPSLTSLCNVALFDREESDIDETKYDSDQEQQTTTNKEEETPSTPTPHERPQKYRKLTNEQREQIITLRNTGTPPRHIASSFKISPNTVYDVCRVFRKENRMEKKPKGGSNRKFDETERKILCEIQDENATYTMNQIRQKFKERTGKEIKSNGTVCNVLKENKYTTKQVSTEPKARNTREAIRKRKEYVLEMSRIDRETLVYLDEWGCNLHTNRKRGRSRIGEKAIVSTATARGGNLSICAAISPVYGLLHYTTRFGAFNQTEFCTFLQDLFKVPRLQCVSHHIVMDNVKFHKTQSVKEVFEACATRHHQTFLPPYSPQLNPIEECFSKWKHYVKINDKDNSADLLRLVHEGSHTITQDNCQGWYNHVFRYYVDCAAGKPLK